MPDKDAKASVEEMLDREAIRELAVRYCHYVWQGDAEGVVNLYTEDGIFKNSDPAWPAAKGHAELRALLEGPQGKVKPRPFNHNHVVDLLGPDTAKGTAYLESHMSLPEGRGLLIGFYDDEYVKVDGAWKFKVREITMEYFGPMANY